MILPDVKPKHVRIGTGNVYVGNPTPALAVTQAVKLGCTSFGWAEGANIWNILIKLHMYHCIGPYENGFENKKDAKDCLLMVRKKYRLKHYSLTQVSHARTDGKVDHNRMAAMGVYDHPHWNRHPAHIAIHPNWVQGIEKGKIVQGYVEAVNNIDRLLEFCFLMRWLPFVTGDFNLSVEEAETRKHKTLYDVFDKYKMRRWTKHLDGIAYPRSVNLVRNWIIPKSTTGADHPWLVADFKR